MMHVTNYQGRIPAQAYSELRASWTQDKQVRLLFVLVCQGFREFERQRLSLDTVCSG